MKSSSGTIPIGILFAGVVIAGAVYVTVAKNRPATTDTNPALVRPVDSSDHILGNPAAKVMIIEYSDFDCEFCKDFHEILHHIIANEGTRGEVAWVFRQFPLSEIHPNALSHAKAAECAGQVAGNDGFWRFADALFARQPVDPSTYGTLAASAGISNSDFATCYATASPTLDARISRDRQNALDIGTQGTPYSLILVAGQPPVVMDGAYPYDAVKQLVDQALGQ